MDEKEGNVLHFKYVPVQCGIWAHCYYYKYTLISACSVELGLFYTNSSNSRLFSMCPKDMIFIDNKLILKIIFMIVSEILA